MSNLSYWRMTAKGEEHEPLSGKIKTKALIIGGGISGVTAAYCLACKGLNPVLIEAGELCAGTTGNTTGKVTLQHEVIYSNLLQKYGDHAAREYAASQAEAIRFVQETAAKEHIDCQWVEDTAWLYACAQNEADILRDEYEAAQRLGIRAQWVDKPDFPKGSLKALGFPGQGAFHAVRYVQGLARAAQQKGAKIYGHTKAVGLEEGPIEVVCENEAVIRAEHVMLATQYPDLSGTLLYFTRLYAQRDYAVAAEGEKEWPAGSYHNMGEPARSLRTHMEQGKRILIAVGETHYTGRDAESSEQHYQNLEAFAREIAGPCRILSRWSAQDYQTPDQIPYIGRLGGDRQVYLATGFGKWGLSSGTLAGRMIADLIVEGKCKYEELYSPKRSDFLSSPGKAATEVLSSVGELIKSKFKAPEELRSLKKGEGLRVRYEGRPAGAYRDEKDHVVVLDIACTHMGTTLNFNPSEKTWDCPAHGGRFDCRGKRLEGPPKEDLPVLYEGSWEALMRATQEE